jgi:hypothetical protein
MAPNLIRGGASDRNPYARHAEGSGATGWKHYLKRRTGTMQGTGSIRIREKIGEGTDSLTVAVR